MQRWEYKVVPAPTKGIKAKGVKTAEDRFALAVETKINELAVLGWQYQRTDMLPSTERSGLTGSATQWRNLLVFRRALEDDETPEVVDLLPPPEIEVEDDAADVDGAAEPEIDNTSDPQEDASVSADDPSLEHEAEDEKSSEDQTTIDRS